MNEDEEANALFGGRRKAAAEAEQDSGGNSERIAANDSDEEANALFGGRRKKHGEEEKKKARDSQSFSDDDDDDDNENLMTQGEGDDDSSGSDEDEATLFSSVSKTGIKSNIDLDMTSETIDYNEIFECLEEASKDPNLVDTLNHPNPRALLKEIGGEKRNAERDAVPQYVSQSAEFAQLYMSLTECDSVLGSLETFLSSFQSDLGGLSEDIRRLQIQSMSKNVSLNNRRAALTLLSPALRSLSISPSLVKKLEQQPINDAYTRLLARFNEKISLLFSPSEQTAKLVGTQAWSDFETQVQQLVSSISDKLVKHIGDETRGSANSYEKRSKLLRALEQQSLFIEFLMKHRPLSVEELREAHVESGSRVYAAALSSYFTALAKSIDRSSGLSKSDLIGTSEQKLHSFFSSKLKKRKISFALGNRLEFASSALNAPMKKKRLSGNNSAESQPSSSGAASNTLQVPFEEFVRSGLLRLSNCVSAEALVVENVFFGEADSVSPLFAGAFQAFQECLHKALGQIHDPLSILAALCVLKEIEQRRPKSSKRVVQLSGLFEQSEQWLLDRFVAQLETHRVSLDKGTLKSLGAGPASSSLSPHYTTRRFAEFGTAIAALNSGYYQSKHVAQSLSMLRASMEALLRRLSESLASSVEREVFFLNNFSLVVDLFEEKHLHKTNEVKRIRSLLQAHAEAYADEELAKEFPRFLQFIRTHSLLVERSKRLLSAKKKAQEEKETDADETAQSSGLEEAKNSSEEASRPPPLSGKDQKQLESVLNDFASKWKVKLGEMKSRALQRFTSLSNGMYVCGVLFERVNSLHVALSLLLVSHAEESSSRKSLKRKMEAVQSDMQFEMEQLIQIN